VSRPTDDEITAILLTICVSSEVRHVDPALADVLCRMVLDAERVEKTVGRVPDVRITCQVLAGFHLGTRGTRCHDAYFADDNHNYVVELPDQA
jgi:hypothetical protein